MGTFLLGQWSPLVFPKVVYLGQSCSLPILMTGSSCPKIREGCRPAGGCEGRCVMRRLCCIAGKWRLKIGMLGFETAPGPVGVVFSHSRHCSSGFQTRGLLSGLLTTKWAGHWPHLAKSLAECLPGKAVSWVGPCTAFLEHRSSASRPWVHRKEQLLACESPPFLRRVPPSAAAAWAGWSQCWGVGPPQECLHWTRSRSTWCLGWSAGTAGGSVREALLVFCTVSRFLHRTRVWGWQRPCKLWFWLWDGGRGCSRLVWTVCWRNC